MPQGITSYQKMRDLVQAALLCRFSLSPRMKWDAQRLREHQEKSLRRLLRFALKRSPFYQKHLLGVDPGRTPLGDLPILSKAVMLQNYDQLVTDRRLKWRELTQHLNEMTYDCYYPTGHKIFRSGASSGTPTVMAYSSREFSHVLAQVLRSSRHLVKIPRLRRLRAANIYARTPTHDSIRISQAFQIGFHKVWDFPVDTPVAKLTEQLNRFQPDILNGYPSVIVELAHQKLLGALQISPQAIFLGSEPLTPAMRQEIAKAFGLQPHDHYGTTEAIILATECPQHRGLHLADDMHLIEIVNRRDQPVKPGEEGFKVLVTNLYAFTQPIIRYELSDILVLDPTPHACPCGNPFRRLQRIVGRHEDLFHFKNTRQEIVSLGHEELRQAIEQCPNLRQFQIIQNENEIAIKALVRDRSNENRTRDEIIRRMSSLLQKMEIKIGRISCHFVEDLERQGSGSQKFRQIWSKERDV